MPSKQAASTTSQVTNQEGSSEDLPDSRPCDRLRIFKELRKLLGIKISGAGILTGIIKLNLPALTLTLAHVSNPANSSFRTHLDRFLLSLRPKCLGALALSATPPHRGALKQGLQTTIKIVQRSSRCSQKPS